MTKGSPKSKFFKNLSHLARQFYNQSLEAKISCEIQEEEYTNLVCHSFVCSLVEKSVFGSALLVVHTISTVEFEQIATKCALFVG